MSVVEGLYLYVFLAWNGVEGVTSLHCDEMVRISQEDEIGPANYAMLMTLLADIKTVTVMKYT